MSLFDEGTGFSMVNVIPCSERNTLQTEIDQKEKQWQMLFLGSCMHSSDVSECSVLSIFVPLSLFVYAGATMTEEIPIGHDINNVDQPQE